MKKERLLHRVFEIVTLYRLQDRDRSRDKSYKRIYLCWFLRNELGSEMTLQEIALHVGYSKHDEVIYACNRHQKIKNTTAYKKQTKPVKVILWYGVESLGQNLAVEVMKAKTESDLKLIQEKLSFGIL